MSLIRLDIGACLDDTIPPCCCWLQLCLCSTSGAFSTPSCFIPVERKPVLELKDRSTLKTRKLIGRCIKTDVDKPSCTCMWILIHQWELGWKEKEKWWLTFLGEHLKKEALNARVFHQLELETPPGPEVKHLQELKPVLLLIFELNCRLTSQDEWEPQTTESSCTSSESLRQVIVFYWKKKNTVLFCQKWKNC